MESAPRLLFERDDLRRIPLSRVGRAFRQMERLRRLIEAAGEVPPGPFLVERAALDGGSDEYRIFSPLDHDQLLGDFLALKEATRGQSRAQAVVKFANGHGLLGRPQLIAVNNSPVAAEWLTDWSIEIDLLFELHATWLWLSTMDPQSHNYLRGHKFLAEHVRHVRDFKEPAFETHRIGTGVDDPDAVECRFGAIAIRLLDPQFALGTGSRPAIAREAIRQVINNRLSGEVEAGVGPKGRLTWVPSSLLATLYLQLASSVFGGKPQSRLCRQCGKVFELTKSDKRYCSTKCVKKASYARHPRRKAGVGGGLGVSPR